MAGETTVLPANAGRLFYQNPGAGMFACEFSLTYGAAQNELADVMEAGFIPAYAKVYAVGWYPTDMDTNATPTVVHKVTVNAVDIVSGLTGAQAATPSFTPVSSAAAATATSASAQKVTVTTTTAAATGAAGTARLVLFCQTAT